MSHLREVVDFGPDDDPALDSHVESALKYAGYVERQARYVNSLRNLDERMIPGDFDYDGVKGLSVESRQKLLEKKPETVGQASRIAGVRAADLSIIVVHLERRRRNGNASRNGDGSDGKRRTA